MTTVQKTTPCNKTCTSKDATPPPTPQIRVSLASAGVCPDGAQFQPNNPPAPPNIPRRDPAYIEIGNWEPGTTFEMINLSDNPTATFDNPKDVIKLAPTGRDIDQRIASVWVDNKQMEKLNLGAGHHYRIRAVDVDGNPSESAPGQLQGQNYQAGQAGRVVEDGAWVPAHNIALLDGEASRENFVLKHIQDDDAPVTKYFEKEVKLVKQDNGNVHLLTAGTLEPQARIEVFNGRTNARKNQAVDQNQNATCDLGALADGDTLFVTVRDNNGIASEPFELRYADKCKDGRGSTLGIIAARLQPSIKRPKAAAQA